MPYNPGVNNNAGVYIAQGMNEGRRNALALFGWLNGEAEQTKQLRKQLTTLYPDESDSFDMMGKSELAGYAAAKAQETADAQQNIMNQYHTALTQHLKQEMGNANAMGNVVQSLANVGGAPLGPGMEGPPSPGPQAGDLIGAMARNPGAEQTHAGQAVLSEWMRNNLNQGPEQGVVPFTLGEGEDAMTGGIERKTGKLFFDIPTTRKLATAKRPALGGAASPAGTGPLMSKDGRSYWDVDPRTGTGRWRPWPHQNQGLSLFPATGGAAGAAPAGDASTEGTNTALSWDDFLKWRGGGGQ